MGRQGGPRATPFGVFSGRLKAPAPIRTIGAIGDNPVTAPRYGEKWIVWPEMRGAPAALSGLACLWQERLDGLLRGRSHVTIEPGRAVRGGPQTLPGRFARMAVATMGGLLAWGGEAPLPDLTQDEVELRVSSGLSCPVGTTEKGDDDEAETR
jgi:hypothetical protein